MTRNSFARVLDSGDWF